MGDLISYEDIEFCRLYGEMSREFYGSIPWELAGPRLAGHWARVRGSCVVGWADARPYVREGWDAAAAKRSHPEGFAAPH
jgi:hypothetical protein